MKVEKIAIERLAQNVGQIDGLPANPRLISGSKMDRLKASLQEDPAFMEARPLLAIERKGELVVIGGNMRLEAARQLGWQEIPCVLLPLATSVETLQRYVLKDNADFGEWDVDALAMNWDKELLENCGVEVDLNVDIPDDFSDADEDEDMGLEDEQGYKIAYELVFDSEEEQERFYALLREMKNALEYDTVSERILAALSFWRDNYGEEK